jgi:hypothetical protein
VNNENFNLTNLRCQKIKSGYCMLFDGGNDTTQYGIVVNSSVANTQAPVKTNLNTSEINFFGGNLGCTGATATTIGMDLGHTNAPTTANGEWGVFGTHILDCQVGVWGNKLNVMQFYGVAELVTQAVSGTVGFEIDDGGGDLIGGSLNNYETCVKIGTTGTAVKDTRIQASLTPNAATGSALNIGTTSLPTTLILTPENYGAAAGATASGSQFGSDLVLFSNLTASPIVSRALLTTITNSATTGTTLNQLAKLTAASPSTAIVTSISDTQDAIGIVVNGAGTTGNAQIATVGQASCLFDNATVAGHFVTISSVTSGNCHDYGASFPPTGQVLGRVLATGSSGTAQPVSLFGPGDVAPAPQVRNSVTLTDDFFSGGVTSGTIGELGWAITNGNIAKIVGQTSHPGILQRQSTATNQIAQTYLAPAANAGLPLASLSSLAFRSVFIFRAESPTGSVTIRMGFADNAASSPPSNGIYFETTTGTWMGVTRSSGTSSTVTGSAIDNLFHTFEIRSDGVNNGVNSVTFWADGTLVGTLTANIPTVALVPFFDIQSTNATTKSLDIDAFQFTMSVTR